MKYITEERLKYILVELINKESKLRNAHSMDAILISGKRLQIECLLDELQDTEDPK